MTCTDCGHTKNRVTCTRHEERDGEERVTRYRECCRCGHRWSTSEVHNVKGPNERALGDSSRR